MRLSRRRSVLVLATTVALALIMSCWTAVQHAHADGGGLAVGNRIETQADARGYTFGDAWKLGWQVDVYDVSSGTVSFDESTKTLVLNNVKMDGIRVAGKVGITLKLIGSNVADGDSFVDVFDYDNDGEYEAYDLTIVGPGSASGKGVNCYGSLTVAGGSISLSNGYGLWARDTITVLGGTVKVANTTNDGVSCDSLKVKGGSVSIAHCRGSVSRGISCYFLRMSGGDISVCDTDDHGIEAYGLLEVAGGTLEVTQANERAISVMGYVAGEKEPYVHHDGVVRVLGGKVVAKVRKPDSFDAIFADKMTNKLGCLNVEGCLNAPGARFKVGGNLYEQTRLNLKLIKYGAKSRYPKFGVVKYGGFKYDVDGFGTKAFATKRGAKVKSVTLKNTLREVDRFAFKGAKSLKTLNLNRLWGDTEYDSGILVSFKWDTYWGKVAKKAFKGCRKSLKVRIKEGKMSKHDLKIYRKAFTTKGMPKSFKLVSKARV